MLDPDISTAGALRHLHRPVGDEPWAVDRRRFLQLVGMGMGAGLVAGPGTSLLDHVLPGHDPSVWAAGPVGPTDGILVVIGMYGGNDGLNTVVPFNDGRYYDQHGRLAIAGEDTIALDANSGLHPALTEFKRFWDAGQLAIVEGVGHGQEEFSHFSSMAMWMAGQPTGIPSSGWIGRWLDDYLGGSKDLFAAAEIGYSLPLQMIGNNSVATTVPAGQPDFGVVREWRVEADQAMFGAIRSMGAAGSPSSWLGRVGQAQIDQLDVAATLSPIIPAELPETEIEAKLEVAARLINANLGFRVLTAGWGDFDSHASQPDMHPLRMQELNAALQKFFSLLHPNWGNRVTVMTFSEFGRTSWDNDGYGTDHGSSAPQFVLGSKVKGGFYGQRPSLAGLQRWDRMPTHVDFRDYYGSVIDGWLDGDASSVLPGNRSDLGLFTSGPDGSPSFPGTILGQFVALTPRRIYDSRDGTGGRSTVIGPGETVKVQIGGLTDVPAGDVEAVAMNISSVRPTETTWITAYPTGLSRPLTASLNPRPGAVVPNMSIVGVGDDGTVSLYNNAGNVHIVIDMMGYYRKNTAARITPLSPSRILDTRFGHGAAERRVRGGETLSLKVTDKAGVPASGVDAIVINLTSVAPTTNGWITAWPSDDDEPLVANLSYRAGEVIPNMVMCKVGADGHILLKPSAGEVHLVADVVGCYTSNGNQLSPVQPARLLDTREGNGAPERKLGAGKEIELQVTGRGGVPTAAKAAVLNVTGIRPSALTFLTIYPNGEDRPTAASLNPAAGAINGNLIVAKIGDGGRVRIYNDVGELHITADVSGYFL